MGPRGISASADTPAGNGVAPQASDMCRTLSCGGFAAKNNARRPPAAPAPGVAPSGKCGFTKTRDPAGNACATSSGHETKPSGGTQPPRYVFFLAASSIQNSAESTAPLAGVY